MGSSNSTKPDCSGNHCLQSRWKGLPDSCATPAAVLLAQYRPGGLRLHPSTPPFLLTPPAHLQCITGVVGLIAIIIYQQGVHLADLEALGMGLSNTFGLCAGILLMGYGLVEIPRHMWKSDAEQLLKWCAHR